MTNCVQIRMSKLITISADYHDITQLLPLMIIVIGKNCTISIIDKQNITVNRQNRLIAHPYLIMSKKLNINGILADAVPESI